MKFDTKTEQAKKDEAKEEEGKYQKFVKLNAFKFNFFIYGQEFDSRYAHIVEIYDFPVSFKNENIINSFKDAT